MFQAYLQIHRTAAPTHVTRHVQRRHRLAVKSRYVNHHSHFETWSKESFSRRARSQQDGDSKSSTFDRDNKWQLTKHIQVKLTAKCAMFNQADCLSSRPNFESWTGRMDETTDVVHLGLWHCEPLHIPIAVIRLLKQLVHGLHTNTKHKSAEMTHSKPWVTQVHHQLQSAVFTMPFFAFS